MNGTMSRGQVGKVLPFLHKEGKVERTGFVPNAKGRIPMYQRRPAPLTAPF